MLVTGWVARIKIQVMSGMRRFPVHSKRKASSGTVHLNIKEKKAAATLIFCCKLDGGFCRVQKQKPWGIIPIDNAEAVVHVADKYLRLGSEIDKGVWLSDLHDQICSSYG